MSGTDSLAGGPWAAGLAHWRSRLLRWLGAIGLALCVTACSEPLPHPLTVGINTWVGYDPLVLARDRGMTDPRQLRVVELISSAEALRHLRNGLLDAAAITLDEAVRLADGGFEVRIVAVLDTSAGADVVLADPRIRDLQMLKGERIAVADATAGTLMVERLRRKAGLQPDDLTVVRLDATQHLTALRSERVAAAVSFAPNDAPIRGQGFRPLFDSREMPGEIVHVLVVRADVLRQRPGAVDALLAAWANGLHVLQLDPPGAAASLAPGADLSSAQYLAVLRGLRFHTPVESLALLTGEPPPLAQKSQGVSQLLAELGLLRRPPDWAALIDVAPAARAADAAGLLP